MRKLTASTTPTISPALITAIRQSGRVMYRDSKRQMPFLLEVALGIRDANNDWTYQQWLKMQAGNPTATIDQLVAQEVQFVVGSLSVPDRAKLLHGCHEAQQHRMNPVKILRKE